MLADALTAMELLEKSQAGRYSLANGVAEVLTERGASSALAMVRHQANCLRNWAQLAKVVRTGRRADREPSVRGAAADLESFIEAMEVVSRAAAGPLVARIGPPPFKHLLDVGGGPATWTIAFLRAAPRDCRATLFDLPDVLPIAEKHLREAGLLDRVTLAGGNFETDPALPAGADLAWVSAIVHMNSRAENRDLFRKVYAALAPGGKVLIRDLVMDESRTVPAEGAMFAVNMLVNTPGGGTFTLGELSEDLAAAGFTDTVLLNRDEGMCSVVQARKPGSSR
jgi:SAM-dependent methyltransferase